MEQFQNFVDEILRFISHPLFTIGESHISVLTMLYLVLLTVLLYYVTGKLNSFLVYKVLAKSKIELGKRVAFGSITRYVVLTVGMIVILQTAGINLSSLTILLGALGVGIGFGLQTITNNLISGLIIFLERPIKVGDRIEVADITGNVVAISMRATEIVTNDNISVIVPNSEFISKTVINWSHSDRKVRFNFPVAISYGSDVNRVREVVLDVAREEPGVLEKPIPDVLLKEFADSAIVLNMRVWTHEFTDRPGVLKSRLYYAIAQRFREEGIDFPFPQRDVHIKHLPEGALPNAANPDAAKPDAAKPDATKPEGTKPEGTKPEGTKPEGE